MTRMLFAIASSVAVLTSSVTAADVDWRSRIAYQRGLEAVVWAMPAVSMLTMRDANFGLGGKGYNTIYYLSKPPTALQEAITPNNQTPYLMVHLNTKNGPVVLEIPPASKRTAIFGSATDVLQAPVADVGPAGLDEGKGGKYLFLPPGNDDKVPDGFLPVQLQLFEVYVALRLIPLDDASFGESAGYAKNINAYALSAAHNPPAGEYVDMAGKHLPTLPTYNMDFFAKIAELIQRERLPERDKVMRGMLASIGIEKGKTFKPNVALKKALQQAVTDGRAYLEYMFETPGYSSESYWPGTQWLGIRQPSKDGFVYDAGDYLLLDDRGSLFHWATFVPRRLGKASAYVMTLRDADGKLLSGDGRYKLSVPPNVPARAFWSVIAYSKQTKAFIDNDIDRVGLSSYDKKSLQTNGDGTIDINFGKTTPEGKKSNWIPTAGEDFFLLFRFYGPEKAFFDKSFKLPDVVRAE